MTLNDLWIIWFLCTFCLDLCLRSKHLLLQIVFNVLHVLLVFPAEIRAQPIKQLCLRSTCIHSQEVTCVLKIFDFALFRHFLSVDPQ